MIEFSTDLLLITVITLVLNQYGVYDVRQLCDVGECGSCHAGDYQGDFDPLEYAPAVHELPMVLQRQPDCGGYFADLSGNDRRDVQGEGIERRGV